LSQENNNKIVTLIGLFLVSIIALVLTPTVATTVTDAAENMTGVSETVLELFPVFWVFMIIGIPVGGLYVTFGKK